MATPKSRLAVTLYTLRDFCNTPADTAKTLAQVRRIGYENVQISGGGLMAQDPAELARLMDDAGLAVIGSHIALAMMRDDFGGTVARLKAWRCAYAAIPWLPPEDRATLADWKARAREFTHLGKAFAAEGITLQYHNHDFEFHKFGGHAGMGGRTGLDILYAFSDPACLQAEIDTAWVARGGGDPAAWCARVKGRMDQVHLKDWRMIGGQPAWTEVGEGNLNWPAILKACRAAGVRHYIVEQDDCPVTQDPFRSIRISYRNLLAMGLR